MGIFRPIIIAIVAVALAPAAAWSADEPGFGPVPGWVRPVAVPTDEGKGEAAVRVLLADQQVRFEKGVIATHVAMALRIQTPQGLAAGNISIPWRPETDRLTVHKLLIRRGTQAIDILASGQTFTVLRREQNLEIAMLDGVLTANIQPEGLQVGDILEYALTIESRDPVLGGHVEQLLGSWNGTPIDRAHLRVEWPSSLPVRVRQIGALPPLKPVTSGGVTTIEASIDHLEPVPTPKDAPARFRIGRLVELSDFRSWADLGALLAPLYDKASLLPAEGPLLAELDRIRAGSSDPRKRAEAALALVQDRIRYVALVMGQGGMVPADATTTWARRYGDCKAKTALLLALLRGLEIDADPVAVNAFVGDGIDARLPLAAAFNHVIVRATIDGRTYWLDGTRTGDLNLDRLEVPDFGWGLPLIAKGAALVRLLPPPLEQPALSNSIRIDARKGIELPAPANAEMVLRGDDAWSTHIGYANLSPAQRERAMREYWRDRYDFIEVKTVGESFDPKSGEQRMTMEGLATMDWGYGSYETDGMSVGYDADFVREPGPDKDAPYVVAYPYHQRSEETILLPPGFSIANVTMPDEVNETVAGIEYRRRVSLADSVFHVIKTERSIVPEFPAKDAPAAQKRLRDLADRTVHIRRPRDYERTPQEIDAVIAKPATNVADLLLRGSLLLDRQRYDEARGSFDRAVQLEPKNADALAARGLALVWLDRLDEAARDLDAANAINSKVSMVLRARGLMLEKQGKYEEALAAFTTAIATDPDNRFTLYHRAQIARQLGRYEMALADTAAAIKLYPELVDLYLTRANIFRNQNKADAALAEAEAVQARNPDSAYAHVVAANIYSAFHRDTEAQRSFEKALAIGPAAYIYLNRSLRRPKEQVALRLADLDAALKLDPRHSGVIAAKADLQIEQGNFAGALAIYEAALADTPNDPYLLTKRGIAYAQLGNQKLAERDFATGSAKVRDPDMLNNLCWTKAISGQSLQTALADCNAAIAKQPAVPAYLDSRGLVLLRLGRTDEAIADYDAVLAKSPLSASSLYGRAIAWSRKGDKAKSDADAAAAIKANLDIEKDFERYGLKR